MTRPAEPIFWTNLPATFSPAPFPPEGAGSFDGRAATRAHADHGDRQMTLDSIGTKFHSDKASGHHGFLGFYERFLAELRHSAVSILEIGVNGGESLRMWEEYFPAAKILGTDHRPECLVNAGGRISVAICEQADVLGWVDLAMRHGPFDLIVDDGTHLWEHQIAAFRAYYPFVRPGGYYILEDIDTSFGSYVELFRGNARMSAAAYLHSLSDLLVGSVSIDTEAVDDAFLKSAALRTEFLAYFRRTALLRRKPA